MILIAIGCIFLGFCIGWWSAFMVVIADQLNEIDERKAGIYRR